MKTIHSLIGLFVLVLSIQSCTHDTCEREVTFMRAHPVWIALHDIHGGIETKAPRALQDPGKIYFYNNYIFINERHEGVHIIDNSEPENPIQLSFINIPGNVDIAVKDGILYADSYIDLVTLDIKDVHNIQQLERLEEVFPHLGEDNGKILVRYDWEEVTEFRDCNSTSSLINQGSLWFETIDVAFDNASGGGGNTGVGGSMARFTIADDYLYVVDNSSLHTFDLSESSQPNHTNTVDIGWNIETIFPYDNQLFIGSSSGMFIYDRSTPDAPSFMSSFAHVTACDPVFVKDNYAYVTLRDGTFCQGFSNQLDLIDISNLYHPKLEKSFKMDNPHGLSISGDHLFLCEGESGIKVFDIEEPKKLDKNLIERVKSIHAYDVIVVPGQDNVLLAIGEDGFYQYNFDNPKHLKLLSSIPVEK